MSYKYDLVVVGGGPGGLEAAQRAAAAGKRVLIMEKTGWGGTCTHRGCIPTKALLTCSKYYADLKKLKRLGINLSSAAFDFNAMKKHQHQMVKVAALGAQKTLADARVETKVGTGEILSPHELKFTDQAGSSQMISTGSIVIAWGSKPQVLSGVDLSGRILTSDGILNLNILPGSIAVVGGSFIGVEFATFFAELGVKVTLLELMDNILPQEDEEAAGFLKQELIRAGVAVHNSTRLNCLKETDSGVTIQVQNNSGQMEWNTDYVLLCTGRKPNLNETELINSGIAYDQTGIKVDENMMTTVPGIYAAGDVTGGMMLAHRAAQQGKVAAANICGYEAPPYNESFIPSVVYSHPPIARVGMTASQAEAQGLTIEIIKSSYGANVIARTELAGQGFVKALFHDDKLIGVTIIGHHASELIASMSLALANGLSRRQLQSWVIPHPTLSEIFLSIFS
ncbi:MAG: dihydrolipoyl dehydrogenase [Syntrophaceae bacterium]|nr:dihydrolipoyl dehydrogenase [Syntrophaceae bacterium]